MSYRYKNFFSIVRSWEKGSNVAEPADGIGERGVIYRIRFLDTQEGMGPQAEVAG